MRKMNLITFPLLLLFINDLLASPVTQKNTPFLNYNTNSRTRSAQTRTIQIPNEEQTFVEDFPDYPKNYIKNLNLDKFSDFFGDEFVDTLDLRFDAEEMGLCSSRKRLIHPKRGKTSRGTWLTIVNDETYSQGILVEECINQGSCEFSQNFPLSVESRCRQSFTYRSLVALNIDGNAVKEHFQFPSCCKCVYTTGYRNGNRNRFGTEEPVKTVTSDPDAYVLPY